MLSCLLGFPQAQLDSGAVLQRASPRCASHPHGPSLSALGPSRKDLSLHSCLPLPFFDGFSPLSLQRTSGGPLVPHLVEMPSFSLSLQKTPPFPLKDAFSHTHTAFFQNSLSASPPSYFSFPDTASLTRLCPLHPLILQMPLPRPSPDVPLFLPSRSESEVAQSCPTLCDPVDCSPPSSSVHGILQARVLEWVAISFSISAQ